MYKLGITGGIGSGKSTAADFFMRKGSVVFDADIEAKNLIKSNAHIRRQIINNFGEQITTDNQLDFNKLSTIIFSSKKLQQSLNTIVWPEVSHHMLNTAENAKNSGVKLFTVDAALILEAGFTEFFNSILLITARKNIRHNRILLRGNIYEAQIIKRMALQMPEYQKKKLVHTTIENNGDISALEIQLELYWKELNIC